MKKYILFLILLYVISTASADIGNWTIDGNAVYVNDSNAYIRVSPHTLSGSGDIIINLTSKKYTGNIDVMFGFNVDDVKPISAGLYNPTYSNVSQSYTCSSPNWFNYTTTPKDFKCWNYQNISTTNNQTNITIWTNTSILVFNHSYLTANLTAKTAYWNKTIFNEYSDVSSAFSKVNYEYGGMNTWYLKQNMPVVAGVSKQLKVNMQVPFKLRTNSGKYWVAIKPTDEALATAITNGHLYVLDPWWNYSKYNAIHMPISDGYRPYVFNFTITNATCGNNQTYICANGKLNKYFSGYNFTLNNATEIPSWMNLANKTDDEIRVYVNVTTNATSLDFWYNEENLGSEVGHSGNIITTFDYSDLSKYTEIDPGSTYTLTSNISTNKIDVVGETTNGANVYLTIPPTGDFKQDLELSMTGTAWSSVIILGDSTSQIGNPWDTNKNGVGLWLGATDNGILPAKFVDGTRTLGTALSITTPSVLYYLTIQKVNTTLTISAYSDEKRTSHVANSPITFTVPNIANFTKLNLLNNNPGQSNPRTYFIQNFHMQRYIPSIPVNPTWGQAETVPNSVGISSNSTSRSFYAGWNKTVDVNWYFNNTLIQTNSSVISASFTNNTNIIGTHNITASGNNSVNTASITWLWTISQTQAGEAIREFIQVIII